MNTTLHHLLRRGWLAALCCAALHTAAAAPATDLASSLHWDLTYRGALRDHPMPSNELVALWAAHLDAGRPIDKKLGQYTGAPVEAALLIEKPDGHAGDPVATLYLKTKTTAQVCTVHPKVAERCDPLDPARTEAFVRAVLRMAAPIPVPSGAARVDGGAGRSILLDYSAFLSAYVDGQALQRPVAALEFDDLARELHQTGQPGAGQLSAAIDALVQTPQGQRERQAGKTQKRLNEAMMMAIHGGDMDATRRLLDQGAQADSADPDQQPLALAVYTGRRAAVDLLLQHGARIDAHENQALRTAMQKRDRAMVDYLLAKGARLDPAPGTSVYETPLGAAVGAGDLALAQLLISRGADPNAPQTRMPVPAAAIAHNLPMLDLLLGAGARPDQKGDDNWTALMRLMQDSGRLGGDATYTLTPAAAATLERIVRRLVAAGADVNYTTPICDNALSTAVDYHLDAMAKLLESLGADPRRKASCRAGQGTTSR